jgi:hypothetical protein
MAFLTWRLHSLGHGAFGVFCRPPVGHAAAEFGVSVDVRLRGRGGLGARHFERAVIHARNQGVALMFIHALSEKHARRSVSPKWRGPAWCAMAVKAMLIQVCRWLILDSQVNGIVGEGMADPLGFSNQGPRQTIHAIAGKSCRKSVRACGDARHQIGVVNPLSQ